MTTEKKGASKNIVSTPEQGQQANNNAAETQSNSGENAIDANAMPIRDPNKIYATKGKLRSSFTKKEWERMGNCGWTEEVETPPEVLALK